MVRFLRTSVHRTVFINSGGSWSMALDGAARDVLPSEIQEHLDFERLISDTSASLIATPFEDLDGAIEATLDRIRVFFRAERCALFRICEDQQVARVMCAALAPGASHVCSSVNLAEQYPWCREKLLIEHEPVIVSCMEDLPAEAARDRTHWEQLATRSQLTVPIVVGSAVRQLIVIQTILEERVWPEDYVARLRLLGEVLVNSLERKRSFEAHRTSEARLAAALEEASRLRQQCQRENVYLREEFSERVGPELVIGHSPATRQAVALAQEVAATNSTVLLIGETGSGKERFAELVHEASPRRARAMIRVNCAAIPEALIENELFGREKGAYTGALSKQVGRFEMASGSTLFLDEVSELPLQMQVKLLRVLQERTIERLGSPRSVPVDVRIVAATNRDLEQAVRDGTFRSDLYYRLNVFPIVVPPLRERLQDIPRLVEAFVDELGPTMGKRFDSIERTSLEALRRYAWPGNVRELRNVVERAMIRAAGRTLRIDLPASVPLTPPLANGGAPIAGLREVEREHILRVLRDTGWRVRGKGAAAEVLGLKPTTLEARMSKLGIRRPALHHK